MSLTNIYHLRRVADTSTKACLICHKPSSSVLITPDNKDFFYVCPAHLKDRHFCSAIIDTEAEQKKKKEADMAKEIELVKKEYEEKQQRKKEKEKKKQKAADDSKDKDKEEEAKKADKTDKSDQKELDEKIESIKKANTGSPSPTEDGPRVFALHKNFYQMRVERLRNIEMAKRNRQRFQDPSLFPSVPSGGL